MKGQVAVVTGGNQGLGLALVRGLCHAFGDQGVVYLAARNRERGEAARQLLLAEGLSPQLALLDVGHSGSVEEMATSLHHQHGGVDVVISNAAARISPDLPASAQVADFIDTNNHGTCRMIEAFGPLLNDGARFVVVASEFGSLRHLPEPLHKRFDVSRLGLQEVEDVMDDYVSLVEDHRATEQGWPEWINIPSKVAQVASIKVMARLMQADATRRGILINAACPGLVDTPASQPWFTNMSGAQSPDEAGSDVVWLATLPDGRREPYGELVQHRRILPFDV